MSSEVPERGSPETMVMISEECADMGLLPCGRDGWDMGTSTLGDGLDVFVVPLVLVVVGKRGFVD